MLYTSESLAANKIAEKLNTPELRQIAYKSYCAHIASGKSKKSWYLEEPVTLTWQTMEAYLKGEYASEFSPIEKEVAAAKALQHWEGIAERCCFDKDINVAAVNMNMRNRHKWDRPDQLFDDEVLVSARTATDAVISQIIQLRSLEAAESPPSE